jgi:hypothetical protein
MLINQKKNESTQEKQKTSGFLIKPRRNFQTSTKSLQILVMFAVA